jgi:hypothetical protein
VSSLLHPTVHGYQCLLTLLGDENDGAEQMGL